MHQILAFNRGDNDNEFNCSTWEMVQIFTDFLISMEEGDSSVE